MAFFLTACGGGGGSSGSSVNPNQALADAAISDAKTYVAQKERDPNAVQFQNLKTYRIGTDATVCGEFNAKNSSGVYQGFRKFVYRPSVGGDYLTYINEWSDLRRLGSSLAYYYLNVYSLAYINTACSDVSKQVADDALVIYLDMIRQ